VSPDAVENIFTLFVHPDVLANEEVKLADDPVAVKFTVFVPSNNIKDPEMDNEPDRFGILYIFKG
jgi:hypothetical protein